MEPGGMKGPTSGLSQQTGEAGGSRSLEAQEEAGAAPTTTGRAGTARRLGSGKRDGKVYVCRNQWWNPLKGYTGSNLVDVGRAAVHAARVFPAGDSMVGAKTSGLEAMGRACGVPMARLQGNSWAPPPPTGAW